MSQQRQHTFFSVILFFETATSRSADRCLTNWANRRGLMYHRPKTASLFLISFKKLNSKNKLYENVLLCRLWMKSWSVTIHWKWTCYWADFPVVQCLVMLYEVVLTFDSSGEIQKCDHSDESYWAVLSCTFLCCYKVVLTFDCGVNEIFQILRCDESDELKPFWAVTSNGHEYIAIWKQNLSVLLWAIAGLKRIQLHNAFTPSSNPFST